jgi:hypothetical protein
MRTLVDARLREEAARFSLRFACEDCAHFDEAAARCAHGYPPAPRRGALDGDELSFCKEFEAG